MRFGYACISSLVPNCSTARTVTVKRLQGLDDPAARQETCRRIAQANLQNTRRLLFHNVSEGLLLYRITPQLVPLATHPILAGWDWAGELAGDFAQVGEVMRQAGMRISSHPGQYTVLSSPTPRVVEAAVADLEYHASLHELLNHGSAGRIVLHVGGAQGGKDAAIARFVANMERLSPRVHQRLVLENDDTVFGTGDVLPLCQALGLPMVLDIHHHAILPAGADLVRDLPAIFATWPPGEPPKIHVSSPRDLADPKAHADFVDSDFFRSFLAQVAQAGVGDFDVMVEAKQKDAAALRLAADIGVDLRAGSLFRGRADLRVGH